jgi:hypothetical protein
MIKKMNSAYRTLAPYIKKIRQSLKHHHFLATLVVVVSVFVIMSQSNLSHVYSTSSKAWSFAAGTDYTYDANKIEFTGGSAQLKASYTPGTNWIATASGNNWNYRKTITINESMVPGSTTLTDFPVLISLTDTDLRTTGNGGSVGKSDGTDIVFTSSDGVTKLSHELERYISTTGELIAWVEVSSLLATTNTTLYMYYGNASATDQQDVSGTWSNGFGGVWHTPDGTTLSANDSTSNNNDGTINGPTATTGKIDGGASIATNQYIAVSSAASINIPTGTWETWFNTNTLASGDYARLFYKDAGGTRAFEVYIRNGQLYTEIFANNHYSTNTTTTISTGTWYHVAGTYDGDVLRIYLNGTSENPNSAPSTNMTTTGGSFGIGRAVGDTFAPYSGKLDEVRISSSVRSADWLATEYNNQNNPATYVSFGTQTNLASYPTDNPTVTLTGNHSYIALTSFAETLGSGSTGSFTYQLSPDNGSTWYWYNGSAWASTSSGYTESSSASTINANISGFTAGGSGTKQLKWRIYAHSDGTQLPKISTLTVTYVSTPADPTIAVASGMTSTAITWNWTDQSTNEDSFTVHNASTDAQVGSVSSSTTASTGTSYNFSESSLTPNTTYSRYVKAVDTGSASNASATATATTLADVPGTPIVIAISSTEITIVIDASTNPAATEFAIYNNTTGQFVTTTGSAQASAVWATKTAFGGTNGVTQAGLTPETAYSYKIKARNSDTTETAYSTLASATTQSAPASGGSGSTPTPTPTITATATPKVTATATPQPTPSAEESTDTATPLEATPTPTPSLSSTDQATAPTTPSQAKTIWQQIGGFFGGIIHAIASFFHWIADGFRHLF